MAGTNPRGGDGATAPAHPHGPASTIDDNQMDRLEESAERHNAPARLQKVTRQNWRCN